MNTPTSTSPTPSGQRHNAVKHGLMAEGITVLDDSTEYTAIRDDLEDEYQPTGAMESFLLNRMALCMTRLNRAAVLEAQYVNSRVASQNPVDPAGTRPDLTTYQVENLNRTYHRYETAIQNKLFQTLKQFRDLRTTPLRALDDRESDPARTTPRTRRCRRRPLPADHRHVSETAPSYPPQEIPQPLADPTIEPLHYQTDSAPGNDDPVSVEPSQIDSAPRQIECTFPANVPPTPERDAPGEQFSPSVRARNADGRIGAAPASNSPSVPSSAEPFEPFADWDTGEDLHSDSAAAKPAVPSCPAPSVVNANQMLLASRFNALLQALDIAALKEWIQDDPGRLLELARLISIQSLETSRHDTFELKAREMRARLDGALRPRREFNGELTEEKRQRISEIIDECIGLS
jgi:hypothetical protein